MRRYAPLTLLLVAACHRGERARTAFDGQRALQLVKTQLDFGPRIPGSPGHRAEGEWLVAQLRPLADTVIVQDWVHVTVNGDTLPMRNVIARFRPQATDRVLYLTHWDTRPVSDGDNSAPDERTLPVPGANDGASGVALQIELARVLRQTPPQYGVDLLFDDGEDYGDFSPGKDQDVFIGTRWFVQHLPSPGYRPIFGVLWDMIGDRDLQIYQEENSVQRAPEVVSRVWDAAANLGYAQYFIPQPKYAVTDDHIPLLDAGMRVIDVIDMDYPYHHTPRDTFDKVSAHSLQVVGDVAVTLVMGGS